MTYTVLLAIVLVTGDGSKPADAQPGEPGGAGAFVNVPTLLDQAERSYLVQRWDKAIGALEQVVAANPTIGYAWWRLGTCRLLAGQHEAAIEAFKKSHALGAFQWRPLRMAYHGESAWGIAAAFARLGQRDLAIEWTRIALAEGLRDIRKFHEKHLESLLKDDEEFRKLVWADDGTKRDRDDSYRRALAFLMHEAKRIHYDPYRTTSEAELDSLAAALEAEIPQLTDDEILVRMQAIVVRLGDGHSHVHTIDKPAILPLHLIQLPQGLFVEGAAEEHADLVGAKVLRIGGCTADEALRRAEGITSRDNEMNVRDVSARLLASVRLLRGLGVHSGDGPVTLEIEDAAGKTREVKLPVLDKPISYQSFVRGVPGCEAPLPLCLRNREKMYWYETLPDERLVFCQINGIGNDTREPFATFCKRLFEAVDKPEVDALVIDMRYNGGGDTFVNVPLIEGIIRCDKLQEPGKLFVIIGRRTFSAAQNTTSELERRTKAILVGEPTGSNPNFIGESIAIPLPGTRFVMSLSDLWWQHSMAMDYRVWTHPQIYAPPTAPALRAHRDPALDAIRAYRGQAAK
jgi:C-terminal processing protease CtpA/Prc